MGTTVPDGWYFGLPWPRERTGRCATPTSSWAGRSFRPPSDLFGPGNPEAPFLKQFCAAVAHELRAVKSAVRVLVAGKHLGDDPLVLRAEPLRLELTVVSGDRALSIDEKHGKAPGAATADSWTLHLPTREPVRTWVEAATRALKHITTDAAPTAGSSSSGPPFCPPTSISTRSGSRAGPADDHRGWDIRLLRGYERRPT
jgi:hypothetical protein